jgi:hypothetical protein
VVRGWWPVALAWLTTRVLVVALLVGVEHDVVGDPRYYAFSLAQLPRLGIGHTLVEYPVPALLLLALPYWLLQAVGAVGAYSGAIAVCGLATDALFGAALVRTRSWRPGVGRLLGIRPAEWVWLLAVPALGATAYARFDLVPGILVGLALLYVAHRPRVAGVLATVAAGAKYWPAIVLPALLGPRPSRRPLALWSGIAVLCLAVPTVALGGWHRVWTPLSFLHGRGLQIESVAATPAMLGFALHPDRYSVSYASSHAYEVAGPAVPGLLHAATVTTVVLALLLLGLWALAARRDASLDATVWLVLASVAGFVVTGKVFSPQYLLWLLPPAAAGLAVARGPETRRRLLGWSATLLVTAVATQAIFPLRYGDLLLHTDHTLGTVLLLAARNVAAVALFLYALNEALWLLAPVADRAHADLTKVEP